VDNDTLERYLHEHIPLSRHLGARVLEAGPDAVRLRAPLAPNLNHRQTAFGGSISALAILSGWVWLHARLGGSRFTGAIVIQRSSLSYLAPGEGDFDAVCRSPDAERWARFAQALERHHRGRLDLEAEVLVGDRIIATFRGRYVALAGRHSNP
jgi:thioesterase domain-containing protein